MASTAFDALVAAARAAAKSKNTSVSNKRKLSRSCAGNKADAAPEALGVEMTKTDVKQYEGDDNHEKKKPKKEQKAMRLMDFQETQEGGTNSKIIISMLKTAAADFEPASAACWNKEDRESYVLVSMPGIPFDFRRVFSVEDSDPIWLH